MPTKLKFKGEQPKKRKRTHADSESERTSNTKDTEEDGWVEAESMDDINTGPLFITLSSTPPIALATDPLGKVVASVLKLEDEADFENASPMDVRQVWIANRLVESNKISLKTPGGKFLSCDKVGILSASKEAIGAEEEWSPIHKEDGWAFENVYGKFMSVDEVAAGGRIETRGDAESIGFNETFILKIQARLRKKAKTSVSTKTEATLSKRELEKIAGKSLTDEQVETLRRAKKEGQLASALLDIRTKSKSDKYA